MQTVRRQLDGTSTHVKDGPGPVTPTGKLGHWPTILLHPDSTLCKAGQGYDPIMETCIVVHIRMEVRLQVGEACNGAKDPVGVPRTNKPSQHLSDCRERARIRAHTYTPTLGEGADRKRVSAVACHTSRRSLRRQEPENGLNVLRRGLCNGSSQRLCRMTKIIGWRMARKMKGTCNLRMINMVKRRPLAHRRLATPWPLHTSLQARTKKRCPALGGID